MIYRTKKITVRLTDKEYAKLREMSETSGLKMEPVIRKLLVGYEIRPRPNATYIKLIKELSAVGNNLNQIAQKAHTLNVIDVQRYDAAVSQFEVAVKEITEAVVSPRPIKW